MVTSFSASACLYCSTKPRLQIHLLSYALHSPFSGLLSRRILSKVLVLLSPALLTPLHKSWSVCLSISLSLSLCVCVCVCVSVCLSIFLLLTFFFPFR